MGAFSSLYNLLDYNNPKYDDKYKRLMYAFTHIFTAALFISLKKLIDF